MSIWTNRQPARRAPPLKHGNTSYSCASSSAAHEDNFKKPPEQPSWIGKFLEKNPPRSPSIPTHTNPHKQLSRIEYASQIQYTAMLDYTDTDSLVSPDTSLTIVYMPNSIP
ncbi:hypothetical protein BD779DRAFT_1241173 [Infundibulicybe gibba]|nr:hypothetical protein BD779DRAFT_1241173 [Infundibulicybe gibba]